MQGTLSSAVPVRRLCRIHTGAERGRYVTQRDRRLALIIIGLLLAIPLIWGILTYVVGFIVDLFV